MTTSDFTNSVIALACWRAAKTELPTVMLAVCQVFMNRAAANATGVYEEAVRYLETNTEGFPDVRNPQFQALISKIGPVLKGLVSDKTDGAIWFIPKDPTSSWPSTFTITTTIGQMVFLR